MGNATEDKSDFRVMSYILEPEARSKFHDLRDPGVITEKKKGGKKKKRKMLHVTNQRLQKGDFFLAVWIAFFQVASNLASRTKQS